MARKEESAAALRERMLRVAGRVQSPHVTTEPDLLEQAGGVQAKGKDSPAARPASGKPSAEEFVKVGTYMSKIRHKQVKQEAIDTDSKEWQVIDRALDLYFKTHYPPEPEASNTNRDSAARQP
jgi:hypothetical protein